MSAHFDRLRKPVCHPGSGFIIRDSIFVDPGPGFAMVEVAIAYRCPGCLKPEEITILPAGRGLDLAELHRAIRHGKQSWVSLRWPPGAPVPAGMALGGPRMPQDESAGKTPPRSGKNGQEGPIPAASNGQERSL